MRSLCLVFFAARSTASETHPSKSSLSQTCSMPHVWAISTAVISARLRIFGCSRSLMVEKHSPSLSLRCLSPHPISTPPEGHLLSSTHSALPDLSSHLVTVRRKRWLHAKQAFCTILFSEYGALLVAVHVHVSSCCGAAQAFCYVCGGLGCKKQTLHGSGVRVVAPCKVCKLVRPTGRVFAGCARRAVRFAVERRFAVSAFFE
jgi:hypothetical protein